MNLFSSIVRSVHKRTKYPSASHRQSRPEFVLSSERLEPRHYLSASGLGQAEGESWHVTYDALKEAYQQQGHAAPHVIGSGYSSSNLNQADVAMLADVVRARYDVTGKGIKIGILSTSFNALGGMDEDIALGLLPAGMNGSDDRGNKYVLNDVSYEDDEGRAMAQLVHAIAPDAELYFATPYEKIEEPDPNQVPDTEETLKSADEWAAGMKTQIETLVNVINVDIIVDDLYEEFVPWFQDGIVAQTVDWAVEGNKKEGRKAVAYFSAAGNDTNTSYQSTFRGTPYSEISSQLPTTAPGNKEQYLYHNFDAHGGIDILQKVQFPVNYAQPDDPNIFVAQWDQPWDNNNSANEIWFFTEDNGELKFVDKTRNEPSQPVAAYLLLPEKLSDYDPVGKTFYVAFVHNTHGYEGGGGQELPTFFKWIAVFNGRQPPVGEVFRKDFPQASFIEHEKHGSSTVWGHNNSKLAANVGAAQYWSTPAYQANPSDWKSVLSEFSSFGGTPIFFDSDGQRQEPEYRPEPRFIAPQNGDTSFFSPVKVDTGYHFPEYLTFGDPDRDYLQNFSGTSAATPNVGAVAALLLELNRELTPAEIYEHLAASALPLPIDTEDRPTIHPPTLPPVGDPEHFNYPTGVGLIRAKEAAARVADISIQGKVFEDFGRNGIQDQGDRPLEGMPVFLDSNGNGIRESEQTLTEPNVQPLTIHSAARYFTPENITYENELIWPAKAGSVITFANMAGTITDLELSYTIHAPQGGDPSGQDRVFLTLISPLGIRVPITGTELKGTAFNSPGNFSHQDSTTVFGSSQTIWMGASPADHMSLADLAAFKHTPANGSWSLEVMNADPNHSYMLDNWSLTLTTEEPQVVTDAQGTYEFPGSHLSFSSAVGAYTPTVELPDNQFITTNNKTAIGRRNLKPTVNIGISLPRVERPELLPSTKIIVDNSVPGPNPFVFSWNNLATSLLPSVSGIRFVVDSVRGTVEKKSGDTWVNVSAPPTTSHPRELLRLLLLRVIKPDDELRWIPPAESLQAEEAFSLVGWNGKFASESKSSIRFEML